ncbi:MAG: regulatory protein RecX [Nitrospinae bacterium]|jgi:regulatory protein|nr:regulatory protein RecX [Nitrospinota bacterium]MDA1108984.1 regulatory protein RecX [Nitrospinota bacterium]
MLDPDELKKAQSTALKYLSYRDRSEFEIRERLGQKDFPQATVQETVSWLNRLGYLNDGRFALNWSRSRISTKKFGEYRLRRELSAKGLTTETIDQTMQVVYSEFSEWELAQSLAQKKLSQLKGVDPKSKSRRLAQYLQRKGFPSDTVFKTVNQLIPNSYDREYSSS